MSKQTFMLGTPDNDDDDVDDDNGAHAIAEARRPHAFSARALGCCGKRCARGCARPSTSWATSSPTTLCSSPRRPCSSRCCSAPVSAGTAWRRKWSACWPPSTAWRRSRATWWTACSPSTAQNTPSTPTCKHRAGTGA